MNNPQYLLLAKAASQEIEIWSLEEDFTPYEVLNSFFEHFKLGKYDPDYVYFLVDAWCEECSKAGEVLEGEEHEMCSNAFMHVEELGFEFASKIIEFSPENPQVLLRRNKLIKRYNLNGVPFVRILHEGTSFVFFLDENEDVVLNGIFDSDGNRLVPSEAIIPKEIWEKAKEVIE